MEIRLGEGIGPISHGMTPAEVRAAFPEPEGYEEWMGGNLNDALLFRGLIVSFTRCDAFGPLPDALVAGIQALGREDLTLDGVPLRQWTRAALRAWLDRRGLAWTETESGWLCAPPRIWFGFDESGNANEVIL
jgi:hypothetical protein